MTGSEGLRPQVAIELSPADLRRAFVLERDPDRKLDFAVALSKSNDSETRLWISKLLNTTFGKHIDPSCINILLSALQEDPSTEIFPMLGSFLKPRNETAFGTAAIAASILAKNCDKMQPGTRLGYGEDVAVTFAKAVRANLDAPNILIDLKNASRLLLGLSV